MSGSIHTRAYSAQDGSKRYVTEVVADEVEFLAKAKDSAAPAQGEAQGTYDGQDGFTQVEDDELPF